MKFIYLLLLLLVITGCSSFPGIDDNMEFLSDQEVLDYVQSPYNKGEMMNKNIYLGIHQGNILKARYPCSDVCPDYTTKIVFYDLNIKECIQRDGSIVTRTVPVGIGSSQGRFCVPKVLTDTFIYLLEDDFPKSDLSENKAKTKEFHEEVQRNKISDYNLFFDFCQEQRFQVVDQEGVGIGKCSKQFVNGFCEDIADVPWAYYLDYLEPFSAIKACRFEGWTNNQSGINIEIIVYNYKIKKYEPYIIKGYVVSKGGTLQLISTPLEFIEEFGPVDSKEEARAFIIALRGLAYGQGYIDLNQLGQLENGAYKIPAPIERKPLFVREGDEGFFVPWYTLIKECTEEVYEKIFLVKRNGEIEEHKSTLLWGSSVKPRCETRS
ncbi:MAG: hypothetical protein Q7K45_07295 [Nanoarchaeota archaeon]|nr:hypothetical protein [Nanoarchaeota archaeon]